MKLVFTLFLSLSSFLITAQINCDWALGAGGEESDGITTTTFDASNNLYVVGSYNSTIDFDPGAGTDFHTATPSSPFSEPDIFIQKFSPNGDYIWGKSIGGKSHDVPKDIKVDSQGNIYVSGMYRDTVDFDPNIGVQNVSVPDYLSSPPNYFILKLDQNADFLWVKTFDNNPLGGWDTWPPGELVVTDNNLYFAGTFEDAIDLNPDLISVEELVSHNSTQDVFLVSLDLNGNYNWGKSFGGNGRDVFTSLDIDQSGDLIMAGFFSDTLDIIVNSQSEQYTALTSDGFVMKLNPQGDPLWVDQISSLSWSGVLEMVVDESNQVYIYGFAEDSVDLDPGSNQLYSTQPSGLPQSNYIIKLDEMGEFIWAKQFPSTVDAVYGSEMAVDSYNNVHLVGGYYDEVDFDPFNAGGEELSFGWLDPFYLSIDQSGLLMNVDIIGNNIDTGEVAYTSISIDPFNKMYLTGFYAPAVSFNMMSGPLALVANSSGNYNNSDYFILKKTAQLLTVDEKIDQQGINVYPNPISNKLQFEVNSPNRFRYEIFDYSGRVVYSGYGDSGENVVDLNTLNSGLYILSIKTENSILTEKIIKE